MRIYDDEDHIGGPLRLRGRLKIGQEGQGTAPGAPPVSFDDAAQSMSSKRYV
jgi:hypothetical protein